jgi:hypothetical protein
MALHLSAGLNAEVGEMAGVFAVRADDFALRVRLSGKGSGRHLEALFLVIPNQILLMLDGLNNSVRRKQEVVMGGCNDSAPSFWFSTLSPPTFSFAPNITPDNFKSPGLAPPPCLPSCPVMCMPHVTCPEDPEA